MKLFLLSCILFTTMVTALRAQEVTGSQNWELIEDHNSDGWADPGETVKINVDIATFSEATSSLSMQNLLEDANLSLVPGSVVSQSGEIVKGNNNADVDVLVEDITFSPPYDKETISFKAKINEKSSGTVVLVTNQSSLAGSFGETQTNIVNIKFKNTPVEASTAFSFPFEILLFILPLALVVLITSVYMKRLVPKLSYFW